MLVLYFYSMLLVLYFHALNLLINYYHNYLDYYLKLYIYIGPLV
jgi:hypothetical protein